MNTPPRGKPAAMKALAVWRYAMGNASYGMLARLFGVSEVAVSQWVRGEAGHTSQPGAMLSSGIVQIDERWHVVNGKKPGLDLAAFVPMARRTLAQELGGRDDETCRRLLDNVGIDAYVFMTDDGEGFPRLIPAERLFPGKDLSFLIVQDNGNVHHYLACFCRRSKITSRAWHRVDQSLRLLAHYLDPRRYDEKQSLALSIFS